MKARGVVLIALALVSAAATAMEPPAGLSPVFLRAEAGARYEEDTTPYGGCALALTPSPYIAFGFGFDFERINTDYPDAELKTSYSVAGNLWGFWPLGRWRLALHGQAGELAYTYTTFASRQYYDVSETSFFIALAPGASYKLSRDIGLGGEGGVRYHPPKRDRDGRTFYFGGAFAEFYL